MDSGHFYSVHMTWILLIQQQRSKKKKKKKTNKEMQMSINISFKLKSFSKLDKTLLIYAAITTSI